MRASHAYDSGYNPAAPVLPIGIGRSGANIIRAEVVAFVDTGADATMIPLAVLRRVGGRPAEQGRVRGILGEPVTVNLYLVAIHIAGYVIHGIRAVALKDNREPILGRDVLNQLELTLNDPAQESWLA